MNYKYFMPTRVLMGENCIFNNKELFKPLGKKALIVTGRQSAKINGSESDIKKALDAVGIAYLVFDQVMSNPTVACAYEGAKIARETQADFIIGVGGGSPMDAAKAIALLAAQEIQEDYLFSGNYSNQVLPLVLVPTTAGTGSEVTQYSILTNDKARTKTSIASDLLYPALAFLDASYTENLSIETTINTAIDALSHAVEGMLSVKASMISNGLACEAIGMIMECVPDMLKAIETRGKFSLKLRETLLNASMMAGIVIAQTGTTAVHAMGYSLTYFKDIDHGRANGLLLGEYLKLVEARDPELVAKILKPMNLGSAYQFKALMDRLFGRKESISRDEINQYSELAIATKNIANCVVKPTEECIRNMYTVSFNA